MRDVLFFDSMLTPKIITLIYWLLLIAVLFGSLGTMFGGLHGFSFGSFVQGIGVLVGGAIGVRIWCELLIVMFKIHENIKKVADK